MSPARLCALLVAAAALLSSCFGHAHSDEHSDDATLVADFARSRAALDEIVRMADEDRHLVRVAPDFTWMATDSSWPRKETGLTPRRWDRYRKLFRQAGVRHGFLRAPDPNQPVLLLLVSTRGMLDSGSAKGYAYSRQELSPLLPSLDPASACREDETTFRRLGSGWYLFYEC